jgi:hypothetical protein
MSCSREEKHVSFGEVAKRLNDGITDADTVRVEGLTQLARVRAIKSVGLEREHKRLQQKLGANHERVATLKAKLDANADVRRDLDIGIGRAATPAAKPDADAWTLRGHVRGRDGKGVANMTIGLYDDKQQWLRELGHDCTDKNGYFELCYMRPKKVDAVEAASVTPPDVFIHVSDKQGAVVHRDRQALMPTFGRVDYREIVLGDEDGCTPPPERDGTVTRTTGAAARTGRFLGNSNTHEIHDTKNVTKRCLIDDIKPEYRVMFKTEKDALAAGFDRCAYCFGKDKSER